MIDIVIPSWVFDEESLSLVEGSIENIRETTNSGQVNLVLACSGGIPSNAGKADAVSVMNPPQGWAAALNHAFLTTDGEWIVVGSADIRVPAGWLGTMLAEAADGNTIVSPLDYKNGKRRTWDATERGSFWGGWYLQPRGALEKVGLLDGYGFRHMADMDWGLRAQVAGYRTVRSAVEAVHIRPHHTMKVREGDPMNKVVRERFIEKWGTTHLGDWERTNGSPS